jgi:hypothetical protein
MAQTKITGDMIADDAVTTALIADDAVTADQLANSINSAITANTAKVTNAITTHTGDVTGGAALTIAVDAVDIPMLSATGSPSNTTFLRGDNAWAAVPAGVDIQSSAPSVASEGSLYYNTTSNLLYASDGTAWQVVGNLPPAATGGTVTIPTQGGFGTVTYNLGLNFADADTPDGNLTYTLESGTLTAGAVLPTSGNSALTGTVTNPSSSTTYNFVIRATDIEGASATQAYTQTITVAPAGGTINTTGGYRYHVFTSSGNLVVSSSASIEYLIVAGGGSGGSRHGGGGGAGGYLTSTLTASVQTYSIVIGAGGVGVEGSGTVGTIGSNSTALGLTSIGGGRGGSLGDNGARGLSTGGGSGAGQSYAGLSTREAGTAGQGNAGGAYLGTATVGAGGGGASGGGYDSTSSAAGNGGPGAQFVDGYYYSGGGGGGSWTNHPAGDGGIGGGGGGNSNFSGQVGTGGGSARNSGGNGSTPPNNSTLTPGGAGGANTGGGGGSADQSGYQSFRGVGGNGGSGIVIIRYAV